MDITLTEDQYRRLLEMVYLGNWMINSTRENTLEEYDDVEQLIFSHADQAATLRGVVEFDAELQAHFPTKDFEESVLLEHKDTYDDDTFWEELIQRLAWRDTERQLGKAALTDPEDPEVQKVKDGHAARYASEFDKNGLDNLAV